jgi:hypothetical protein
MQPLTRNCFLGFATAGALALTVASTPSFAGDPPEVLGPVGPNDPIITAVGRKTVLAFYEADGSHCSMHIVMWDRGDESGDSAAGFRVTRPVRWFTRHRPEQIDWLPVRQRG